MSVLQPGRAWTTWGHTYSGTPQGWAAVSSEEEARAVLLAAASAGLRVKVAGTGHSFSDVAHTLGVRVDISALSGLRRHNPETLQATFAAGTPLWEVGPILAELGWALPNMGDIDRQTIAGALSTGTHGTGARWGSLATTLCSARLMIADGRVLEVSATENAELWPAVRLGLGTLGIVLEMTVQCVPAFGLTVTEGQESFTTAVDGFAQRCAENDHAEFFWFPHTERVLTKISRRLALESTPAPPSALSLWFAERFLGNTVLGLACRLGQAVPRWIPAINRIAVRVSGTRTVSGRSSERFVSPRTVRFVEMEYAVPPDAVPEILRRLRAAIEAHGLKISFPVEVRIAAGDDIWLSTAHGGPRAYIAVHQYRGAPFAEYFALAEEIFQSYGGRPHWGKWNTATASYLSTVYPHLEDFQAVRRSVDPGGLFANDYTDRVLGVAAGPAAAR